MFGYGDYEAILPNEFKRVKNKKDRSTSQPFSTKGEGSTG